MGSLTIKWLFKDSLAAISAISLPLILQCPGTHSRVMFLFMEFKILSILILILWSDLLLFKNCSELRLSLNITKLLLSSVDIYLSAFSMAYNSALKTLVWGGNLFWIVTGVSRSTTTAHPHLLSILEPSVYNLMCPSYLCSTRFLKSAWNSCSVQSFFFFWLMRNLH